MTGLIGKYGRNYASLLKLALPIVIGQLGGIITGLADTIMVGQHSTAELAASSFVNNVLNAFIIFGTGFSFALTPLVGENLAREKRYVVSAWLKNGIVANFLLSLVLIAILTIIYFNVEHLGQPAELMPLIKALFCEVNPIPVKAAVAAMGFGENYLRLPLTPMEEGNKAKLLKLMAEQNLI